ncbi:MAG TPA: hypothetical protein VHM23_09200 [Actinomycetota bacterium]|jgi:hypothetical protein|nr:hypothetical protein [Actinomycetota bacterium]
MSGLVVVPVGTRQEQRAFIDLPLSCTARTRAGWRRGAASSDGNAPLTQEEAQASGRQWRRFWDPSLMVIAAQGEEPVGWP